MSRAYHISRERTISDEWGRLKSIRYELQGSDGRMHPATAELYDAGNAVAVLLYNKARRTVLLNRQFRIATVYNGHPDGMLTEVCAGKIEGLSPEETVRKEIAEETGYIVSEVREVMKLYMSPGAFTELLHLYVAACDPEQKRGEGGGLKQEGEYIEVTEVPFDDALDMIEKGEIVDAKTVLLLQYAALKGLL